MKSRKITFYASHSLVLILGAVLAHSFTTQGDLEELGSEPSKMTSIHLAARSDEGNPSKPIRLQAHDNVYLREELKQEIAVTEFVIDEAKKSLRFYPVATKVDGHLSQSFQQLFELSDEEVDRVNEILPAFHNKIVSFMNSEFKGKGVDTLTTHFKDHVKTSFKKDLKGTLSPAQIEYLYLNLIYRSSAIEEQFFHKSLH